MAQVFIFMKRIKSFFDLTLPAALLLFMVTLQSNCTFAGKPATPGHCKKNYYRS